MEEKIISAKRNCQSLFGSIPSGLVTLFTIPITGHAVRHEFILLETENHLILIEISAETKSKQMPFIAININNF
jgi:hypothetical protein